LIYDNLPGARQKTIVDEQKHRSRLSHLGQLTRANAAAVMCDKCQELDQKIARYRRLLARVLDAQVAASITELIEEAEAEKATLHRAQQS
jgi:hypothetical protein